MKNHFLLIFIIKLIIILFPNFLSAQTVSGYVIDKQSRKAVEGAVVILSGGSETLFFEVERDGFYIFEISPGTYILSCNYRGYENYMIQNLRLNHNDFKSLDIELQKESHIDPQVPSNYSSDNQNVMRATYDRIITDEGVEIKAIIQEIGQETIKYRKYEHQTGPLRVISKSNVFMIVFMDGSIDILNIKDANERAQFNNIDIESNKNVKLNKNNTSSVTSDNINLGTINFGIRAGYFIPSEKAIKEIYGNGVSFGSDLTFWMNKGFGGGVSIEYFNKKGEPIILVGNVDESETEISIFPISLLGYYKISNTSTITPYFGAGIGLILFKEKLSFSSYYYGDESVSTSDNTINIKFLVGIHTKPLYFELQYNYTNYTDGQGLSGSSTDFGGLTISGGLKF